MRSPAPSRRPAATHRGEARLLPLRIGTAGWSIPRACAEDFPGSGSHLERFARVLPCSEINSTSYRSPRPSTYGRWVAAVPEGFRFSVKAPKSITHEAALACTPAVLRAFLEEARSLGPKLGPILFQLPPKLVFDPARAQTFFATLRDLYPGPAVLEPRHASWFEPEADTLLKQLHISRAAADPARTPSAAHPGGHPALVYYRLHGSPRTYYSSYSPEFLQRLAQDITRHREAGKSETWCIFDNTASGAAAGNALLLAKIADVARIAQEKGRSGG